MVALLVGDPRRPRAVHRARRRGPSLEHRRARGMATILGGRGHRRRALPRERAGRLPRRARVPRGEAEVTRIQRLASLLDEPLLVAGPPYILGGQANVRYL